MDNETPEQGEATAQDPSKFYAMLGRALTDKDFRDKLTNKDNRDDQIAALNDVGITGNMDIVIPLLNSSIDAVDKLAGTGGTFAANAKAVT